MNDVAAHINPIVPPAAAHDTYSQPQNGCWKETHDKGKLSVSPALTRYVPYDSEPTKPHTQATRQEP